jgi:hypothetical protein
MKKKDIRGIYQTPELVTVTLDSNISLTMASFPEGDPEGWGAKLIDHDPMSNDLNLT